MTDRKAQSDQTDTPEDVATLYSWANLHGAKYRDFSAARAQTREKARLRVEGAMEEHERRAREAEQERLRAIELEDAMERAEVERAADAAHAAESARAEASRRAEEAHRAEIAAQAAREAEWSRQQAARQLELAASQARKAAESAAWQPGERSVDRAPAQEWRNVAAHAEAGGGGHSSHRDPLQPSPGPPPQTRNPWPSPRPAQAASVQTQEAYAHERAAWQQPEQREAASGPAWLFNERGAQPGAAFVPPVADDTLQGSRERMTTRWFALRSLYEPRAEPPEAAPAQAISRPPVLAVFSLAGGVGKTSLVANLGRALAGLGERMLLVDTASFGLLPFFFGARDQRPGVLRTFSPPAPSSEAPVQLITIDHQELGPDAPGQEFLANEIARHAHSASRVIVDLATASGAASRRILRLQPLVLSPLTPDMNSVVSVGSIDVFFQQNGGAAGKPLQPYYVLNQFDASLPLHLDVREVLRAQLGDRLLPFPLRRAPAMSEALAEGMTVMDYAPGSMLAEDFGLLAGWVKSHSSPAAAAYRGVRWSER